MKDIIEQDCPLCGTSAEFVGADYGRRKTFKCGVCSYFQISTMAERKLESSVQNWRDALVQKVKETPEKKMLVITSSSSSDAGKGGNAALQAEYVPENEVPS